MTQFRWNKKNSIFNIISGIILMSLITSLFLLHLYSWIWWDYSQDFTFDNYKNIVIWLIIFFTWSAIVEEYKW